MALIRSVFFGCFSIALLFLQSSSLWAINAEQELVANRIIQNAMSPYCPGKLLANCPTAQATDLKRKIFKLAEEGKSYDEIMLGLYSEFGEEVIRASPKNTGFGAFAWYIPIVFIGMGILVAVGFLKKSVKPDKGLAQPD